MFNKTISLIMCILILISILSACTAHFNTDETLGEANTTTVDSSEYMQSPHVDTPDTGSSLPPEPPFYDNYHSPFDPLDPNNFEGADIPEDVDYGGYKFSILADNTLVGKEFIEESNRSIMQDALILRQEYIEDFVGIEFDIIKSNGGDNNSEAFISEISSASASGTPFDLVLAHNLVAPIAAAKGLSRDLGESAQLNIINSLKSYWGNGSNIETMVNGRIFWLSENSSWNNIRNMLCLYVNTDLLYRNTDIKDKYLLYDLVYKFEWDFETLLSLVQEFYENADASDKVPKLQFDDSYTLGLQAGGSGEWIDAWFHAAGFKYTKQTSKGTYEWTLSDQDEINFINWWQKNLNDPNIDTHGSHANNMFTDKRAMFSLSTLALAEHKLDFDFTILPLPLYDEHIKDSYSTTLVNGYSSWLIPKAVSQEAFERSSTVLELIAAEGNRRIVPAHTELYFKIQLDTYDPDIHKMLQAIRNFVVFDIGVLYGSNLSVEYIGENITITEAIYRIWECDDTGYCSDITTVWSGIKDSASSKLNDIMVDLLDY